MRRNRTIIVASRNQGKIAEIIDLFKVFPISIKTLNDFGPIPVVEENGLTFSENAYKKASFTSRVLGIPALSDDSGLVVPSLAGAPGVYSARYAGVNSTDLQKCHKLLQELEDCSDRRAYFSCVISIVVPTGKSLTFEGRCDGQITEYIIGENGFGYDPIFFCSEMNKTFAQLSIDEKNKISHRGIAFRKMVCNFDEVLDWLDFQMPADSENKCCAGSV